MNWMQIFHYIQIHVQTCIGLYLVGMHLGGKWNNLEKTALCKGKLGIYLQHMLSEL